MRLFQNTLPQLPLREGVSASCLVLPSARQPLWPTLLDALAERLPGVTRADWQQRLDAGDVCNADGQALAATSTPRSGQRVYYWRHITCEPTLPFEHQVLYHDGHLVVADKPHFLPVTPGGPHAAETLLARLRRQLDEPALTPLHRIDRETAGLVVLGLRPEERGAYQSLFRTRHIHKTYEAVAPWRPELPWSPAKTASGDLGAGAPELWRSSHLRDDPLRFFLMEEAPTELGLAPNSQTRVVCVHRLGSGQGFYRLYPVTGKRHQLRVHMAALGLPLMNDPLYPEVLHGPHSLPDHDKPLQLLARSLSFVDPIAGELRSFESRLQLADSLAPLT
jgi:tRNA pseudouridine32 synthase/23S rRNA pseudouridine746 synthase